MNDKIKEPDEPVQVQWQRIVHQVGVEFDRLDERERTWIAARLTHISAVQREMQALVDRVDIAAACHDCHGSCCDCGKNHFNLVNLLFFLMDGETVPEVDFSRGCPFLTANGCCLEVGVRPFNCVTFICDEVEDRLAVAERDRFYMLEKELRECYREFEQRYAGAGAQGLLLRSERLGGRGYFAPGLG